MQQIGTLQVTEKPAILTAIGAGSPAGDFGNAIAVNSFSDIYIAGQIGAGTVDFDLTQSYFDDLDLLSGPGGFLWQIRQP